MPTPTLDQAQTASLQILLAAPRLAAHTLGLLVIAALLGILAVGSFSAHLASTVAGLASGRISGLDPAAARTAGS